MPQSAQDVMADPKFQALSPEAKAIVLGKVDKKFAALSPEAQQIVLGRMGKPSPSARATATISAKPPLLSAKGLKSAAYTGADYLTNLLPTIGGGIGGIIGGGAGFLSGGAPSVPGGLAGAAIGGAGGEAAKQLSRRALFGSDPAMSGVPATSGEAAKSIGKEAALQSAYELGGQALGRGISTLTRAPAKAAIPLTHAEATGGRASSFMERLSEGSIPGGGVFRKFREQQLAAIKNYAENIINNLSKFGGSAEERGKLVQQALDATKAQMKEQENAAYRGLDQITRSKTMRLAETQERPTSIVDEFGRPQSYEATVLRKQQVGGVQPSTLPLKKTAIRLLREIQKEEKVIPPQLLADSKSILQRIVKSPKKVPFEAMQRGRSDLLALTRRLDEVLPGRRAGISKVLSKEADQAMIDAATEAGPEYAAQLRVAQAITKDLHEQFEQTLVKKIIETNRPEDIAALVRGGGIEELRVYNNLVPQATRRNVSAQIMRDMLDDGLRSETGAQLSGTAKAFQADKFSEQLRTLGEERGRLIFGDPAWKAMTTLRDVTSRINIRPNEWVPKLHNYFYLEAGIQAMMGNVHHAIPAAADWGYMYLLAHAATNPAGVQRIGRFMAAVARNSPRAMDATGRSLATYMRQQRQQESPQF